MVCALKIQTQIQDKKVVVELSGSIDEDSDFGKIQQIKADQFEFDFGDVKLINSCGIREWIKFLDSLGNDLDITYRRCPQILVEQMNMVFGFIRPGVKVESFYAPYYCEALDIEEKILLHTKDLKDGHPPCLKHEGHEMEFDAIEEQYLNFLHQVKGK